MIEIKKGREPEGLAELRQAAADAGLSAEKAYASFKGPLKEGYGKAW